MPNLTDEQVAAFPEIVEAADRLAQELTSGMAAHLCPSCGGRDAHGRYCNVARLEAALAAAEPKVPTLVEAATDVLPCLLAVYPTAHEALCGAIIREREAQAAAERAMDAVVEQVRDEAPEAVADHGEPVHYNFGAGHHQLYTRRGSEADGTRQMQCFNALAGCNPGELAALLKHVQRWVNSWEGTETGRGLREALLAFKPEPKTWTAQRAKAVAD